MLIGDIQNWTDKFISFDDRLVERIAILWPKCISALPAQPKEDDITINLVDHMVKDPIVRRLCHWVEYHFEPFGISADGSKYSKGIIDFAVLLDQEREQYLAYECKRLNVTNANGRSSLATVYVTEGMMRFITEKYAEQLPVGCMLGYVMDGDIPFAHTCLSNAITDHTTLALIDGPTSLATLGIIERFRTRHTRVSGTEIEIRHILLSR